MLDDLLAQELGDAARNNIPGTLKYARLQDALLACIVDQRLKAGSRLPSDKDLSQQLGVSLGTVQKALGNLEKQGIVSRAPRRGTIIEENQVSEDDTFVFRFRDPLTNDLIPPRVRGISVQEDFREGPWKEHLNCERMTRFERLLQVGLEPPVYSEVFVPFDLARDWGASQEDAQHGYSVHRYLQRVHGLPIIYTKNSVRIGGFDSDAQRHLMLDADTQGLVWDVSGFSFGDKPTSFQRLHIPPDHRPIEFRRDLSK